MTVTTARRIARKQPHCNHGQTISKALKTQVQEYRHDQPQRQEGLQNCNTTSTIITSVLMTNE